MTQDTKHGKETILGKVDFPPQWTAFGPFEGADVEIPAEAMKTLPSELAIAGKNVAAERVTPTRCQYDFASLYGDPPYDRPRSTFIFVPLHSEARQEATFGFGADWYLQVWLNGEQILSTMSEGNLAAPPAINNHLVAATLQAGNNMLLVRLVNGLGMKGVIAAMGGPQELRKGEFKTIIPPTEEPDAARLLEQFPPDPEAPIQWAMPDRFDPRKPGLGLTEMEQAEHVELYHSLHSNAAIDDGGTGVYESIQHGTFNHNMGAVRFQDRLIATWHNHSRDENGPGCRRLAKAGKIINAHGDVDWGGPDTLVELAPAPVPVRRRKTQNERDAVREAMVEVDLREVDGRLICTGNLIAIYGVTTRVNRSVPRGEALSPEEFAFARSADMPRANFARWELGFRFFQEWGVLDDKFQPLSPLYKENDLPKELPVTTQLSLPLEPLVPPYSEAPLLSEAPDDFQAIANKARQARQTAQEFYQPGTQHLTVDGTNGLVHGAYFNRPDGSSVAVRENQRPMTQPFYYAAEKSSAEPWFPPARRSNLYGAADPAAGELVDGTCYIIANSPNRQNMYITASQDGRLFDRTWLLLYRRISDFTPGAMKNQGSPGSGPQYFRPVLIGENLWIIYSLSKEHVGATRVPVEALR